MLASKYFFFLTPIPVVFYLSVRGTGTAWRVPVKRWAQLIGLAIPLWAALNWTPFLPPTWEYAKSYISGGQTIHGSLFFMGRIYHNLVEYTVRGTPPWFYLVFAAVKLAPATFVFALAGLAWPSSSGVRPTASCSRGSACGSWSTPSSAPSGAASSLGAAGVPDPRGLCRRPGGGARAPRLARRRRRGRGDDRDGAPLVGARRRPPSPTRRTSGSTSAPSAAATPRSPGTSPTATTSTPASARPSSRSRRTRSPTPRSPPRFDWPSKLYAERAGRFDLHHTLVRRGLHLQARAGLLRGGADGEDLLPQPGRRAPPRAADALVRGAESAERTWSRSTGSCPASRRFRTSSVVVSRR